MIILELKCPKCHNKMLYSPRNDYLKKSKKCVYCGKSFRVSSNIIRIIKKY
ncbi:MAG: hypothetical protein QXU20_03930 [Candidatus Woesearchaeota archaeon]